MKTLFILVSILALSYLALQTSVVKSLISGISNPFDSGLENAHLENNQLVNNAAKVHEKLIVSFSEFAKQSAQDKQDFTQRLSELEKNIEVLTDSIQNNIIEHVSTPHAVSITEQQVLDSNLTKEVIASRIQVAGVKAFANTAEPKEMSVVKSNEEINQQQKRIQQQAVLRALSHKMELAALSNLVN